MIGFRGHAQRLLGNLREIIGELVFLDDKKMIAIGFDQSQITESLHEEADSGPRRADHLGQLFVRDLKLDANTARVFLTHSAGEL